MVTQEAFQEYTKKRHEESTFEEEKSQQLILPFPRQDAFQRKKKSTREEKLSGDVRMVSPSNIGV